ncbi:MAG: hypothetical protein E6K10_09400 [Methanobacteriota archaeon]|nr:MAG: hypothetical protein E6K10_09400 [Euryarchaeota archaeon]
MWLAAALAAWFAALGIAGTERGKMAFLSWLVLPLYTRMKKEEVLDQFTRGQIYGYIVVHPGDSYVDVKRNLQLNNGTLTHHLNVLERDGLIRSKNVGTRKLFFAAGARIPEDGGGMHEVQQQILRHLRETGSCESSDGRSGSSHTPNRRRPRHLPPRESGPRLPVLGRARPR